jgi:hypothetical protein
MKAKKTNKAKHITNKQQKDDHPALSPISEDKAASIASHSLTIPFDAMFRFLRQDRNLLPWLDALLRKHKAIFAGAGYDELRLRFEDCGYSVYLGLYLTYRSEGPQSWRLASDFVDQDVTNDNGVVAPQGVIKRLRVRVGAFVSDLQCRLSEGIHVVANSLTEDELAQALEMGDDQE